MSQQDSMWNEVPGLAAQQAVAIDPLDLRILGALAEQPDTTVRDLAQTLGIPASTCAFRLRSLRARGVLLDARLRVDPTALGYPVQAVIRVRLGNHSKSGVDALFDALAATPGVLQVFHIAGADDFLVHVAVTDAASLRDIVLEHITVHDVVRATETQLVFELREGPGVLPSARLRD
ncbi:Lrp/AsnC family transcriptional regulator [Microbacterium sp. NPDC057650]|uniref:Lrp/AsnC family transcriptional regulator n=2 Tax=unclassified Microbacterium TaxID=2609290 RepID=UPI00366E9797